MQTGNSVALGTVELCGRYGSNSTASGTFYYTQHSANKTVISYEITGLVPLSVHGIHIHETAVFTPRGCLSAGGHYNPFYYEHGGHDDDKRHMGDLGNIKADGNGTARGSLTSNLIQLYGQFSVMHRSSMLHADEDDCILTRMDVTSRTSLTKMLATQEYYEKRL